MAPACTAGATTCVPHFGQATFLPPWASMTCIFVWHDGHSNTSMRRSYLTVRDSAATFGRADRAKSTPTFTLPCRHVQKLLQNHERLFSSRLGINRPSPAALGRRWG